MHQDQGLNDRPKVKVMMNVPNVKSMMCQELESKGIMRRTTRMIMVTSTVNITMMT